MAKLEPKPGFDWGRVTWSAPDSRIAPICSYCFTGMPTRDDHVPLMMFDDASRMAQFCDACMVKWWGFAPCIDEQDG